MGRNQSPVSVTRASQRRTPAAEHDDAAGVFRYSPRTMTSPAPRDAATVVLLRHRDDPDVFWVKRSPVTSYLGGFHTVPGGRVDRSDGDVVVRELPGDADAAPYVAAVRELFEEAGVLLARGAERLAPERLRALRRALLDGTRTFRALLAETECAIDARDLESAGRWITPPFTPTRFDTRFFLAWMPEGQHAEVWTGELVEGEWIRPRDALARWRSGESLLTPPTLHVLEQVHRALSSGTDIGAMLRDIPDVQRGPTRKIEMRPGIFLVPLAAPTLPPATHTNCYVVGARDLVVIDPGSPYPEEQQILDDFLTRLADEGRRVTAVVVTHHHRDHWGGAERVRDRFGVPIYVHMRTAPHVPFTATIAHDNVLVCDADGDRPERKLRMVHTPGHTRGHLALFEEHTRTFLAGDLFAGTGTVIIDPPDGDMQSYFDSLAKVRDLGVSAILPGHGAPTGGARERIEEYIAHRLDRERRILAAVECGAAGIGEIVARAYTDVAPSLHVYAARSALAHLYKLVADGRIVQRGEEEFAPAGIPA